MSSFDSRTVLTFEKEGSAGLLHAGLPGMEFHQGFQPWSARGGPAKHLKTYP